MWPVTLLVLVTATWAARPRPLPDRPFEHRALTYPFSVSQDLPPAHLPPPPPLILTETQVIAETMTVTQTQHHTHTQTAQRVVTVPAPASTRNAAYPAPEVGYASPATSHIPKTTSIEIIHEEELFETLVPTPPEPTTVITHHQPQRAPMQPLPPRQPKRWGW
jgi:hypothetical protein